MRPVLELDVGMGVGLVASCLLVYGLAGVAGNFTLGPMAGRYTKEAVTTALAGVAPAAALLPFATASTVTVLIALVIWGASYGGVSVSTQTWVRTTDRIPVSPTAATLRLSDPAGLPCAPPDSICGCTPATSGDRPGAATPSPAPHPANSGSAICGWTGAGCQPCCTKRSRVHR
ncbi:hypothetical protein [Streptomyces sp. NPDC002722]|uniref:hypothetical protein n=1 Tax=unclassified Streptomyces TaxID=2593676 RepID=UPI00332B61A5